MSLAGAGSHLVEAAVSAPGDVLPDNNSRTREIIVEPRPRVLYVHAAADATGAAPRALTRAGFRVTIARPAALPQHPEAFDAWDVVVLSNVGAHRAHAGSDGGTRLVGRGARRWTCWSSVAAPCSAKGSIASSPGIGTRDIERVLPVTFDRDDEPEVALVIVLDRSWSMNGTAMELSKAAAEAAANTLAPAQMLGVLTFNSASNWDVPLGHVRDSRPALHDAIARITASGPTAIYPALAEAYGALAGIRARARHVVLLSDGQSDPQGFEALVRRMAAARITVSTVALGPEADAMLLRNLAAWGGGRSYIVQDAQQIPEIFVKEAQNAATPGSDEGGAMRVSVRQALAFLDAATDFPAIKGHNTVTRKPQAIEWLGIGRNDPLLAIWPAGLGRTAMFAADLDGRWTPEWLQWRGLAGFLGGVVRSLAPRRLPSSSLTVTAGDAARVAAAVDDLARCARPGWPACESADPGGRGPRRRRPGLR